MMQQIPQTFAAQAREDCQEVLADHWDVRVAIDVVQAPEVWSHSGDH
jgi:hypothetical protein